MNIFQKLMSWLFGWEYVILVHHSNAMPVKHAYRLGDAWYAHPYLPHTRCELLPNGVVNGQSYIKGWKPVTPAMFQHYNHGQERLLDES